MAGKMYMPKIWPRIGYFYEAIASLKGLPKDWKNQRKRRFAYKDFAITEQVMPRTMAVKKQLCRIRKF